MYKLYQWNVQIIFQSVQVRFQNAHESLINYTDK